jgi:uncharacterized protein YjiS (DUF1127 family)
MNIIHTLVVTVREQLQAASARRRQRLALNDLLSMNAARLDDLGLNRHDVIEAIAASRHSEPDLEARRERNASRKLAFSVH